VGARNRRPVTHIKDVRPSIDSARCLARFWPRIAAQTTPGSRRGHRHGRIGPRDSSPRVGPHEGCVPGRPMLRLTVPRPGPFIDVDSLNMLIRPQRTSRTDANGNSFPAKFCAQAPMLATRGPGSTRTRRPEHVFGDSIIFKGRESDMYLASIPKSSFSISPNPGEFFHVTDVPPATHRLGCLAYDNALVAVAMNRLVSLADVAPPDMLAKFARDRIETRP
jgi:hypothetical protein